MDTTQCPVCSHLLEVSETSRVNHTAEHATCPCPCEGSWSDPHRHPTGDHYEAVDGGLVRVEALESGASGLFHLDGRWHSGELMWADPHMVYFVTSLPVAVAS